MKIPKPTDEDKAWFQSLVPDAPGVTTRPMFGNLAAFVNGNMFTGLHQANWIVRLPPDALQELIGAGGKQFEPMPGRPMTGFAALPADVLADDDAIRRWVDRAFAHASSMPPKKGK